MVRQLTPEQAAQLSDLVTNMCLTLYGSGDTNAQLKERVLRALAQAARVEASARASERVLVEKEKFKGGRIYLRR